MEGGMLIIFKRGGRRWNILVWRRRDRPVEQELENSGTKG